MTPKKPPYSMNGLSRLFEYSPYFGVASAALIFISWIVTTTAVANADALQQELRTAVAAYEEFDRHMQVMNAFSNIDKQLNRIELRRSFEDTGRDQVRYELTSAGDSLQWIDAWQGDVSRLYRFNLSLRELSTKLSVHDELRIDAEKTLVEVEKLSSDFHKERERWTAVLGSLTGGKMSYSLTNPPSNWKDIVSAASRHEQTARELVESHLPMMNRLHIHFSEIRSSIDLSLESARFWAKASRWLTYFIFIVGTVLSIYAKMIEQREKRLGSQSST